MAKHKEIETKWDASAVRHKVFAKSIRDFLKKNRFRSTDLRVGGYDYYYVSKCGHVLRHREGKDSNELTAKARIKDESITVRKEINIKLARASSPLDIEAMLELLGFKKDFAIYKWCDILFVKDGNAEVSIVWYKVTSTKSRPRIFMEVEVDKVSQSEGLRILKKWHSVMHELFGLSKKDVINDSLYEIYSGKRYKKV